MEIYVNTPASGIITKSGYDLANQFDVAMMNCPSRAFDEFEPIAYAETKRLAADFLMAAATEIAFIPNFSYGLSAIIASLRQKHNRVLLYQHDYESVTLPFKLNKFEIDWIDSQGFSNDILLNAIEKTKAELLVISHVQYLSGYKSDLKLIGDACKEKGIRLIIDATQSMGLADIDFEHLNVDVILSSNYKWMNAGYGSGTLLCKEEFIDSYQPVIGGRNSMRMINGNFTFPGDLNSYEPGHLPIHNLLLLNGALKEKLEIGKTDIELHAKALMKSFFENLDQHLFEIVGGTSTENKAGIVCIRNIKGLYNYLTECGVVCVERGENVRFGFHYHNSKEEIEELCRILNSFTKH